jgi:hypothetical protein
MSAQTRRYVPRGYQPIDVKKPQGGGDTFTAVGSGVGGGISVPAIVGIIFLVAFCFTLMGIVISQGTRVSAAEDKDMVLMSNVTSLVNSIVAEEVARLTKDMQLMSNVTDINALLSSLQAFDAYSIEQFMIKMGNITTLDGRIDGEENARIAKDMELMNTDAVLAGNITTLDAQNTIQGDNISGVQNSITVLVDALGQSLTRSKALGAPLALTGALYHPPAFVIDIDQSWVQWYPPTVDPTIHHQILENGTYCFAGYIEFNVIGPSLSIQQFYVRKVDTNGVIYDSRGLILASDRVSFHSFSYNIDMVAGEYIKYEARASGGSPGVTLSPNSYIWVFKRL